MMPSIQSQPLAKPIDALPSDKTHGHVDTSHVTFQINDQMPVPSVRRGYMNWADQGLTASKIVRIPAVVFGELVILNKSDVSLLIECNFNDVFESDIGPLVM